MAGSHQLQQLHRFPGATRQSEVQAGAGRQAAVCAHPERIRAGAAQNHDCRPGELPAGGWQRGHTGGSSALHRRAADHKACLATTAQASSAPPGLPS